MTEPSEGPEVSTKEGIVKRGKLHANTAKAYLQKAGGDKAKARELAKADGWEF